MKRGPLLLLIPVAYIATIVATRLATLGVVAFDAALAVQMIVVPLAQMGALALALATTGRRWR